MTTRILLVEDSATQAEAVRATLEDGGYRVSVATTGDDALRALGAEPADVVLSDVVMPGAVDGYELCRQIKHGARPETPVVLLTSLSDPLDIIRGLEAGADNFLIKPCEPAHLLERLSVLLATRRARTRGRIRTGVTVYFMGREFTISAEREQILDLLVTTFEDAVRQNHELRQRERDLSRSRETLAGLYQVAVGLNACTTEQDVVDTALERALTLPGVRAGWISLRDGPTGFRLAATRNLPPALAAPGAMEGDCLCRRQLLTGQLGQVTNILECERLRLATDDTQGLRHHASVPLHSGSRVLGIMNLVGESEVFSDDDLVILYGVGSQIAFAVERARLWNHLEQLVEDRTTALRTEMEERERAQDALRLSDSILQLIGNVVLVGDGEGLIRYASPSVRAVLGYEPSDVLGNGWWQLTCPEPEEGQALRHEAGRRARGDLPPAREPYERWITGLDGTGRWILWTESQGPDGLLIGVGYDITERKRLEDQVHQAQKMEAVGRLAGGIAHDFNNILATILTTADLLLVDVPEDSAGRPDVVEIRQAARRASQLTRQLLALSRKQVLQARVLDLNEIIRGVDGMLRRVLREDIEFTASLAADLGRVRVDPGQMEQVLMNLVVNARDAIPAAGKVTIETRNMELDQSYVQAHAGVIPGSYVLLAVSDTGVGMDEAVLDHMFEPFFTTKEVGKGTGLGLATVHGIVRQNGGHVWAYSEARKGSSFKIYFPRVVEAAERRTAAPPSTSVAPGGRETILLAEDDAALRAVTGEILRRVGYTVLEAPSGDAALALAQSHAGPIDLLLSDVVMPGKSAQALASEFVGLRRGARVLFMSGYTNDAIDNQRLLDAGLHFIEKPFDLATLTRKVRDVLDTA